MPLTAAAILEGISLATAILDLASDVGEAGARAYVRHCEEADIPVTAAVIQTMINDYKPTRDILAEMGVEL